MDVRFGNAPIFGRPSLQIRAGLTRRAAQRAGLRRRTGHNPPMSIQPLLQVDAAFFRRQMPDLILREGSTLAARVAERHGRHGLITLAGTPLLAELPDGVKTGDTLRLLVADTRGE